MNPWRCVGWLRLIRSLIGPTTRPKIRHPRRYRPVLECLEDRLAPAVTSFAGNILTIDVNHAGETVTVSNNGTNITILSNQSITGEGHTFSTGQVHSIVVTDRAIWRTSRSRSPARHRSRCPAAWNQPASRRSRSIRPSRRPGRRASR